jgi:N-acetylneuraminic acid mutarotase
MIFSIRFKSLALFIAGLVSMTGERSWADESSSQVFLKWNAIAELPPSGDQSESLGVAGPFVGVSNDVLIVAGGANFPKPYWGQAKVWHDDIWVLDKSGEWHSGGKLPRPIGYGKK